MTPSKPNSGAVAALVDRLDALGAAEDPAASVELLSYAGHGQAAVRLAVAQNLPLLFLASEPPAEVVAVLVDLTQDAAGRIRDFACFGLGQLRADSPSVRAALVARLDDADRDCRCEALVALAQLRDPQALTAVRARLRRWPDWVSRLELEAAAILADPPLLPLLDVIVAESSGPDDPGGQAWDESLRIARLRCAPDAAGRAAEIEAELVARINASRPVQVGAVGSYPWTEIVFADASGSPLTGWDCEQLWSPFSELIAPQTFDLDTWIAERRYVLGAIDLAD